VITDAASLAACAIIAPMRDQIAPLANRPRSESAVHMPLIALIALFHDPTSIGIKGNPPASELLTKIAALAAESLRPQGFPELIRLQFSR
jgi:hypothetical protein